MSGPVSEPVSDERPVLRVVKGDATPEEVAALVAVVQGLAAAAAQPAAGPAVPGSTWAAPARRLRTPHHAGPGAWRASGLPR